MVDDSKLKFECIPIADIPKGRARKESAWDDIFSKIPKGQALVLREPDVSAGSVRAALKHRHRLGKFKNLQLTTRGKHKSSIIYVMNTEKPSEKSTIKLVEQKKS